MNKTDDNLQVLLDMQNLTPGWNGYDGKKISTEAILLARRIILILGDYQPEIYPTGRGTVQMQYELPDRSYLEFEVFPDRIEILEVPKRIYSKAKELTIPIKQYTQIVSIVEDFYKRNSA